MDNVNALELNKPVIAEHQLLALANACDGDVFSVLGIHEHDENCLIYRVYKPDADIVKVSALYLNNNEQTLLTLKRYQDSDLFYLLFDQHQFKITPILTLYYPSDTPFRQHDVYELDSYCLPSTLDSHAMYLFNEGTLAHAHLHLGAHYQNMMNTPGVRFTVWAPNAQVVSVVGDFNFWQADRHMMRKHPASGVWEIFIGGVIEGQAYKFSLLTANGERIEKADPYARLMQKAPETASVIASKAMIIGASEQTQTSPAVLDNPLRIEQLPEDINACSSPISIYEVHLGSWKRAGPDNHFLTYRELAHSLVDYVEDMGFTHVQFMPMSEYPFEGSWGYQPIGMFSPTNRLGSAADFLFLVNAFKQKGIGVLLDWVPAHFPSDNHGLATFDGTHLYEHADARQGFHPDWQTHIFNYGRAEVRSYLLSSANFWLETFGLSGLRVDAVASMLYLDYSREDNEWVPNEYGGRDNLAAIDFIKQLNSVLTQRHPSAAMVAEESTAWGGVTNSTTDGGLGFNYKWNMGWMNDSLSFMKNDPVHRQYHLDEMTFSLVYSFSEQFILPLSHDEVVHGKGSMINKMPGDDWQKFANLRCYYAFMWAHPGKKLMFMGSEFAQYHEWSHEQSLDWHLLNDQKHLQIQSLVRALNRIYRTNQALYRDDLKGEGFQWVDAQNYQQSILSFIRYTRTFENAVICVTNFTPVVHEHFLLGVPNASHYRLLLNTDDCLYGGSGVNCTPNNDNHLQVTSQPMHGYKQSVELTIPPLATIYLMAEVSN